MSSPMIAWEPIVNRFFRYLTAAPDTSSVMSIDLPQVVIHNVEATTDKRLRTLRHLFRANHINHAIFYSNLIFHNHLPHLLGSAYILGADVQHLHDIYDKGSKDLTPWKASPTEVVTKEWRNYLGDRHYQRGYVDFFEDELALKFHYNWKSLVQEYLLSGKEPLINGLISGLGHSLIHLSYAFEFSCRELAIEALAMVSVEYDFLHKYLDDCSFTKPSPFTSHSPIEIINRIYKDTRFDNLFTHPGFTNIEPLFKICEDHMVEYWNSWIIDNPIKQFEESQDVAIQILLRTVEPGVQKFDFYIAHILTTSHAIRILLSFIPPSFHVNLLRQWWLLTIAVYISQLRPAIRNDPVKTYPGKDWKYVRDKGVRGVWATDYHYAKVLRAIEEIASTWGDAQGHYLAAAVRFADDFDGWCGFPPR